MSDFTDESIVQKAQCGDIEAMDKLIKKYTSTAYKKAARLYESVQLHDVDDLAQEAMIGFLSAVYSFEQGKGASFMTYANVCMNNRLCSVACSMNAKRYVPQSAIISLESSENILDTAQGDPQELAISQYQADRISEIIKTQLSDFEYKVVRLFLSGSNYTDIAKQLSTDRKAVDNAMQRIRRKLKMKISQE